MNGVESKAAYVLAQRQTRRHSCHWPGCQQEVPPALWGCKRHWYALPKALRTRVWRAYRPGQEITGRPSAAYMAVMRDVCRWIDGYLARRDGAQARLL